MMKIMLIDDEMISNFVNSRLLEHGWPEAEIIVCTRAIEALEIIAQGKEPDLILLDIRMPEMDGLQFLKEFNSRFSDLLETVKIVMLSSSLDENDLKTAMGFPNVKQFFSKPLSHSKIEELKGLI